MTCCDYSAINLLPFRKSWFILMFTLVGTWDSLSSVLILMLNMIEFSNFSISMDSEFSMKIKSTSFVESVWTWRPIYDIIFFSRFQLCFFVLILTSFGWVTISLSYSYVPHIWVFDVFDLIILSRFESFKHIDVQHVVFLYTQSAIKLSEIHWNTTHIYSEANNAKPLELSWKVKLSLKEALFKVSWHIFKIN